MILKKPYEISLWKDVLTYYGSKYVTAASTDTGTFYSLSYSYMEVQQMVIDDFYNNKKSFYYLDNDQYVQCSQSDQYDDSKTYYIQTKVFTQIPEYEDGCYKLSSTTGTDIRDFKTVSYQYYTEQKIMVLGSDTMTSIARATNPIYTRNVNGTEQLTFDMYYQYEEPTTGELVHNPIVDLIIDERKVKLKYQIEGEDDPWHDFIVKKDDEKARENKYSFTCTGLAANELGKNGFNLEFNVELENNLGTIDELTDEVLKDSDWQRDTTLSEAIKQITNEALYTTTITEAITAKKISNDNSFSVPSGARIYIYYTPMANQVKDYFQFIYSTKNTPSLLEDKVTISCNDVDTFDLYIDSVEYTNNRPNFCNPLIVSIYRGDRYVRKQLTHYDPTLKQTVGVYTKVGGGDTEYYGYSTTEYISVDTVVNYIYNSENFKATNYWYIYSDSNNPTLSTVTFPYVTASNARTATFTDYLRYNFNSGSNARLRNDGIIQNYNRIKNFEKDQWYRLKIKISQASVDSSNKITAVTPITTASNMPLVCKIASYTLGYTIDPNKVHFNFAASEISGVCTGFAYDSNTGYFIADAKCLVNASWEDLSKNVSIFFLPKTSNNNTYLIEDVQLFRRIENGNHGYLDIGDVPEVRVKSYWHFYDSANIGKIDADSYEYDGTDPNNYIAKYGTDNEKFEKRRSITISESNRYNIIQELSETFECWARFKVYHNISTGAITVENYYIYTAKKVTSSNYNSYYYYDWTTRSYKSASGTIYDANRQYYSRATRKRQKKRVYYINSVTSENAIGFKYGINLKDVQRTLDSDQIVTKIIVKNNTREEADNGFCSIARAKDNPIRENFALNLDYYTSQGIINKTLLDNDIYLEDGNGSIGLYPKLARENQQRNEMIEEQALRENEITNLTAQTQAAYLAYNTAVDELQKIIDPINGILYQNSGYIFDDFLNQSTRVSFISGEAAGIKIHSYSNTIYCIPTYKAGTEDTANTGTLTAVKLYQYSGSSAFVFPSFYRKIAYNQIVGGQTYYYIGNTKVENEDEPTTYSSGHFIAVNYNKAENYPATRQYFEKISSNATINAGVYFETKNKTNFMSLEGSNKPEVYIYLAHRREDPDFEPSYYSSYTHSIIEKIHTYENIKEENETKYNLYDNDLKTLQAEFDTVDEQLKKIALNTAEIEKEFNTKYARYIQEGTWTDDNYIDDDLYYLDALNVLYQSAYPKVTYNISVLELSQLEGYEAFKFDIGHKTFVEDTEFFGYIYGETGQEPAREWVVVTEAKFNLDENDKNSLKVQNYKAHFEDLFQRITAATQSLEYHSGEYAKAAAVVTPEGAIDEVAMQRTFATAAYVIQNAHDQSVTWDNQGILATNLSDPSQVVRIASGGILISSDGGQTWGTAITGYGINANYINAGVIDTNKLEILNGAYPTFKWDYHGLHAFSFTENEQGNIYSYDPSSYVTFDRFGLYGINGLSLDQANFESVNEVQNNALFALTWNGLFIRNNHTHGSTSITPEQDLIVSDGIRVRAHFGYVSNDATQNSSPAYGMSLYDANGNPTVVTQSDGTLWLQNSMRIGKQNQTNTIYIGVGEDDTEVQGRYKVIKVNDLSNNEKFIVYSDGTLKASGAIIDGSGTFTGTINANGGTIGNMNIATLSETIGVRITPTNGTFKVNNSVATPTSMVFSYKTSVTVSGAVLWKHSTTPAINFSTGTTSGNTYTYTYNNSDFYNGVMYLGVQIKDSENNIYTDVIPIEWVKDGDKGDQGAPGADGVSYTYAITSSLGNVINTSNLPSGTTATTINGFIYKTVGNNAPVNITSQASNWSWQYSIDNGTTWNTINNQTTSSFTYLLAGWTEIQFKFSAEISG